MAPQRKYLRKDRKATQHHRAMAVNQNTLNERHNPFDNDSTVGLEHETEIPRNNVSIEHSPHHDPDYEHKTAANNFLLQHPSPTNVSTHHEHMNHNTSPITHDNPMSYQSTTNTHSNSSTAHNQIQNQTQLQNKTHSATFIEINRPWGHDAINDNSNASSITNCHQLHLHQTPTLTSGISPIQQWANSSIYEGPWNALAFVPIHGMEAQGLDMDMDGDHGAGEEEEGGSMAYYAPSYQ